MIIPCAFCDESFVSNDNELICPSCAEEVEDEDNWEVEENDL